MTIGKRLLLLLAVPLIALLGFGVFARIQLSRIEERSRFVSESQLAGVAVLGNISRSFAEIRVNVRSFLLATDQTQRAEARAAFDEDDRVLTQLLQQYGDSLISDDARPQAFRRFQGFEPAVHRRSPARDGAGRGRAEGRCPRRLSRPTLPQQVSRSARSPASGSNTTGSLGNNAARAALAAIEETRWEILAADVAALLLTGLLGFLTFRRIVNPIQALERSVKTVAAGDYTQSVPFTNATDETGGLARSIEVLKQGAAAIDEQRWVKSSASNVIGELQGANTLPEFGQRFLSGLVPLLGGGVAAFYVLDDETGRLQRTAAYGLDAGAEAAATFAVGEGLVGQCAQDRKPVRLTSLPADYFRIVSAVGTGTPVQVVASPLLFKSTLLGVVEVATFHQFNSRETALLDELMPLAAMSLEVLQRNLRLLAQQTELTAQRERLRETEQFFRSVLELAPDGLMVVDANGVIRLASARCEPLFGYTRDELIGQPVEMLVPRGRASDSCRAAGAVSSISHCP